MVITMNCDSYKVKMILESNEWQVAMALRQGTESDNDSIQFTQVCSQPCGMHHIRFHKLYITVNNSNNKPT